MPTILAKERFGRQFYNHSGTEQEYFKAADVWLVWKRSSEKSERYKTASRAAANCWNQKWMRAWWEKRWRALISAVKWPLSFKSLRRIIWNIISWNNPARQVWDLPNHILNSHGPDQSYVCAGEPSWPRRDQFWTLADQTGLFVMHLKYITVHWHNHHAVTSLRVRFRSRTEAGLLRANR